MWCISLQLFVWMDNRSIQNKNFGNFLVNDRHKKEKVNYFFIIENHV